MAVRVVRQCCAAPAGAEPPAQQLTPRQRRLKKQQRQHRQQKEQTQRQPPPQHQQQQLVTGAAAAVATPLPPLGCPHFNTCSGCSLSDGLHQPPVLSDAVHYFSQHGIAGFRLHAGSPHGWRRRARLAVRAGPVIGLFEEGSHAAVPIPSCV